MENKALLNATRFTGFSDIYDKARPVMPKKAIEFVLVYLQTQPDTVVDLGCGTGLSTTAWQGYCKRAVGIEPSEDMLNVARQKQAANITFKHGCGHQIPLSDQCADAVICSQSFHWMEPISTLTEVNRILHKNGVFATVDCDWPPVCCWAAEKAYQILFESVAEIEEKYSSEVVPFTKWPKEEHLNNIRNSKHFRFLREIVFSQKEHCTPERYINLALSQGGLQSVLKTHPSLIAPHIDSFVRAVNTAFGDTQFEIEFGYRMRLAVK